MAAVSGVIVLAGGEMSVEEAAGRLACYPARTPANYDLPRCRPGPVTAEEIKRTRTINSRISNNEGAWFREVSHTSDWSAIPANARLADATPKW